MKAISLGMVCALALLGCAQDEDAAARDREEREWIRLRSVEWYWTKERTNMLNHLGSTLQHMSEPVYWGNSTNQLSTLSYRFLWLRTFHEPVLVKIRPVEGGVEVHTKIFSRENGFDVGDIKLERVITNGTLSAVSLLKELDERLFHVPEWDGDLGADGATWMIDGTRAGRYKMVQRWSPKSGWVRYIGLRFLDLAELKDVKVY